MRGIGGISCIACLLSLATTGLGHAGIVQRSIFVNPGTQQPVNVLSEDAVDALCLYAWNKKYNLFDAPRSLCALPAGAETNVEYYFILDSSQGLMRAVGSIEASAGGPLEATWLGAFGVAGNGYGKYRLPTSVTVSPRGPGCYRDVFVLDAGNNRIERVRFESCGQTFASLGYVVDGDIAALGSLNRAQDIDYVATGDDTNLDNDFIVVADTYNHRVLAFEVDGTLLWSYGSGVAGDGPGQLCFPWAVTGIRQADAGAASFIYIADRGNNRIVRLYQNGQFGVSADRVLDLPTDKPRQTHGVGGYAITGIEDIEVDAFVVHSGVFVLDSRTSKIIQLDYPLSEVVSEQSVDESARLGDLEVARGTLGVMQAYTKTTGTEMYEIRASIENLAASPASFAPPFEWAHISMTVTALGLLDVWVETTAGAMVDTLYWDWTAYPGHEFTAWDGKNWQGNAMPPGTYRIKARLDDTYWIYSETRQINVTLASNNNVRVLKTHPSIRDPEWSPDGGKIAYSATVSSQTRIRALDLVTQAETNLTNGESGAHYQPSWSTDGAQLLWRKEVTPYFTSFLYVSNADGTGRTRVSGIGVPDTDFYWEEQPEWSPVGNGSFAYLRHMGSVDSVNVRIGVSSQARTALLVGALRKDLSWSPDGARIAQVTDGIGVIPDEIRVFDASAGAQQTVTPEVDDFRIIHGIDWSPDGTRIAFTEHGEWQIGESGIAEGRWSVKVLPPGGGDVASVNGLTSEDAFAEPGVSWSPDGTKIAFPIGSAVSTSLVIVDFKREQDGAFPSAVLSAPAARSVVNGVVDIVGSVGRNTSVDGSTVLSTATDYTIEWGVGSAPESWSSAGVVETYPPGPDMNFSNSVLGTWNTATVASGVYHIRLRATDGTDENVITRFVEVRHERYEVDDSGGRDYTTIQPALDACAPGDTVVVFAGTYNQNLTLRSGVNLIAAEDGATVVGQGSSFGVRADALQVSPYIKGFTITHQQGYYSNSSGIYVNGCSPTFDSCVIRDHNTNIGGGVRVVGNAAPVFEYCRFENNRAPSGGAVAIWGIGAAAPVVTMRHCEFIANQAPSSTGGAIWMNYDTPLDVSKPQSSFFDCTFAENVANEGSAVWMFYCHRPEFIKCAFIENHLQLGGNGGGVIDGSDSGVVAQRCTFVGNDNTASEFYVFDVSGYVPSPKTVFLRNCIIAQNPDGVAVNPTWPSRYDVYGCDFYANKSGDSYWLTAGVACLNQDPIFCASPESAYSLKAHSPCADEVSPVGQIGFESVACVPTATIEAIPSPGQITPDTLLFGCPKGDAEKLMIRVTLSAGDRKRDVGQEELVLNSALYPDWGMFSDHVVTADSVLSQSDGITTLTHANVSGYGQNSLEVVLNGFPLTPTSFVQRRGPDFDLSGWVNVSDFAFFGSHYQPNGGTYDQSCDFDGDGFVGSSDFARYGAHHDHQYVAGQGPMTASTSRSPSGGTIRLDIREEHPAIGPRRLVIATALDGVDPFSAMLIALRSDNPRLSFGEWVPNEDYAGGSMVSEVTRDGMKQIMIGLIGSGDRGSSVELGTFDMLVAGDAPFELADNDLALVTADVLDADRRQMSSVSQTNLIRSTAPPVYRDELAQNYPNPFNPSTTIAFSLAKAADVELRIFDVRGASVRTLVTGRREKGVHRVPWSGRNDVGQPVASGVYFYRIVAGSFTDTKKMVLLH